MTLTEYKERRAALLNDLAALDSEFNGGSFSVNNKEKQLIMGLSTDYMKIYNVWNLNYFYLSSDSNESYQIRPCIQDNNNQYFKFKANSGTGTIIDKNKTSDSSKDYYNRTYYRFPSFMPIFKC